LDFTQRKKEIVDPRSLKIWQFPEHPNIEDDMRRSPVASKITQNPKSVLFKNLSLKKDIDT
jgi:hypothetical protein